MRETCDQANKKWRLRKPVTMELLGTLALPHLRNILCLNLHQGAVILGAFPHNHQDSEMQSPFSTYETVLLALLEIRCLIASYRPI